MSKPYVPYGTERYRHRQVSTQNFVTYNLWQKYWEAQVIFHFLLYLTYLPLSPKTMLFAIYSNSPWSIATLFWGKGDFHFSSFKEI